MKKTKTNRKIWTILLAVAFVLVAAVFVWYTQRDTNDAPVLEDVNMEEVIKAEDLEEEAGTETAEKDAPTLETVEDNEAENSSLEYISDFKQSQGTFNALGVSWEEVNTKTTDVTFYVRVKNNGTTSQWYKVDKISEGASGGATSYAAEAPLLVEGQEYQYKVVFTSSENEVKNIEINIINTSASSSYSDFFDKITSIFAGGTATAAPNITSRSGWGCGAPNNTKQELQDYADNNSISVNVDNIHWPAQYASSTSKFIVHHTAGANNPSNPAAAVRAVWVYHTYSRAWGDIGYNYLVDQNGQIYTGRYGGDNVISGHAAPYNLDEGADAVSSGISVLGDFSSYVPNSNILNGLADIIGYKAFTFNINPLGTGGFEDKNTYNIAGHKNYTATACPGNELYAKLPTVRSAASAKMDDYGHTIDDLVIDSLTPAIGDTINGSFTLTNVKDTEVTLESLKIVGRRGTVNEDFPSAPVTIPAGGTYDYSKSKAITAAGDYDFYVQYKEGGIWYDVHATAGSTSENVTAYATAASVEMSSSLATSPEFSVSGETASASFYLRNTGAQPKLYPRIKIITKDASSGSQVYHSWAKDNVTVPGNTNYKFSTGATLPEGNYDLSVEYKDTDDSWYTFSTEAGVADSKDDVYFYASSSDPKVSESLALSDNDILAGNPITATFKVTNYGDAPVRFDSLKVAVRRNDTYNYDYASMSDVVLCKAGDASAICDVSGTLSYSKTQTFYNNGDYTMWIAAKINGSWVDLSTNSGITTTTSLDVENINYGKLVLKIFKTNDTTPAIGQPLYVDYRINNNNSYPVTLSRVKAVARLDNGVNSDFPGYSSVTIPAGGYKNFRERQVITSYRDMDVWISFYDGSSWKKLARDSGVPSVIGHVKHFPNIKVTSSMNVSPEAAMTGSTFDATFKLKNYEGGTIYIKSVKATDRVGSKNTDFPGVNVGIAPGTTYTYSKSRVQSLGVDHRAEVAFRYANSTWAAPVKASSAVYLYDWYKVYIETATLEGIPLPASSGKVGREQHLAFECQETRSHHYSTSNTPVSAQNGMAWETSGGCGYGAWATPASVANERYYINMRWNYTDLHGQAILTDKSWYYGKRVVVTNPANGKKVVAAIIEYGPGIMTRVSGLSPEAMLAISAVTDNNLTYKWAADQSTPLGPVN